MYFYLPPMEDFDRAAQHYKSDFDENPLALHQRTLMYSRLRKVVTKGVRVLELGCGTGVDALWMASQGAKVLATDASPEMIAVLKKKAQTSVQVQAIETRILKMPEPFPLPDASVDLVFSNFGALNCLSAEGLQKVLAECKRVLVPQGTVMFALMPRFCFWECVYFMIRLKPRSAFRRFGQGVKYVEYHGAQIETYFHDPAQLRRIMSPSFLHISFRPMGLVSPFPGLMKLWNRVGGLMGWLLPLDRLFFWLKCGSSYSDHYLVEGARK